MVKAFARRLVKTILLAGLLVTIGCGGLDLPVAATSSPQGKEVIDVKASSFKFEPNNITVPKPGSLTLAVLNVSDSEHNITIRNPDGQTLNSVNLPPGIKTFVTVDLPIAGTYIFFCDKSLHESLGMKGQIEVGSQ